MNLKAFKLKKMGPNTWRLFLVAQIAIDNDGS
jgi:hypothetical protein